MKKKLDNKKLIIIAIAAIVIVIVVVVILGSRPSDNPAENEGESNVESTVVESTTSTSNQIHTAEGSGMTETEYSSFIESIKNPTESTVTGGDGEKYVFTEHAGTNDDPVPLGEWTEAVIPTKENAVEKADTATALIRVTNCTTEGNETVIEYEIIVPDGYPLAQGNSFYPRTVFEMNGNKGNNASDVTLNCRAGYVAKGKCVCSGKAGKATLVNPNGDGVVFSLRKYLQ